jgi:DNA-binding winged helix-turn-helix (wHTH) protein/Tfp pilus assembly protein PilF
MSGRSRQYFDFDDFRVDVENRVLLRNGLPLPLHPKTFDVLVVLTRRAGETVDKDELLGEVWTDTFVEEGNLAKHISTLRQVLGDTPSEQRFVKTIPKRGYRFTADVREVGDAGSMIVVEEVSRERLTVHEETMTDAWPRWPIVAAAGVLVSVLAVGWAFFGAGANAKERRWSRNAEAIEAYEKGRELWKSRSPQSLHEATLLLERAVEKDPDFALAHSALADAYTFDYGNWQKAEGEARLAIGLDPSLGQPYATLGFIKMHWFWRVADAEADLKRAVELSPDYPVAHHWYALDLASRQRLDAAQVEIRKALELDPMSAPIHADNCHILYLDQRNSEALAECKKALSIDPALASAHLLLDDIYSALGMNDEAVNKYIENRSIIGENFTSGDAATLRQAYAAGGIAGFRRAKLDQLVTKQTYYFEIAKEYARLGENANALAALAKSADHREWDLLYMSDPIFKALRFDPEYYRIASEMQIERTQ